MAKDAYYFSHDSNARTDPKILALISDYGVAGYGMWWVLVEILREQDEYKLKHNKCTWKATAMQMQCNAEIVQKFITDCVEEYELLEQITEENGDNYIYSPSLVRRMEKLDTIRFKRSQAASKRWENKEETMQNDANAEQMQCNSMQSKVNLVKESKPSKEKKRKELDTRFDFFYSLYPNKISKAEALKAWNKINLTDELFELIMSKLELYKKTEQWEKDNGKFIPMPSTWINQRRWEDEIKAQDEQQVRLGIKRDTWDGEIRGDKATEDPYYQKYIAKNRDDGWMP